VFFQAIPRGGEKKKGTENYFLYRNLCRKRKKEGKKKKGCTCEKSSPTSTNQRGGPSKSHNSTLSSSSNRKKREGSITDSQGGSIFSLSLNGEGGTEW